MSSATLEILIIILLILLSGFFAMSEMALVSARKARLQEWARQGNRRARAALDLAKTPNRFLATAQIGMTLIGVLAGAYGGVTLAEHLALHLARVPALAGISHPLAVAIVVLATTFLTLVLGELAPKRLALNAPERVATIVTGPMRALASLVAPAVWLLSASVDVVIRLLRVRPESGPPVTEEEIKILLEQGQAAGVFEEAEQEMVEQVLRLDRRRVSALMTPRPELVWLDVEDPREDLRRQVVESSFSRFPVCRGTLDDVLGILQVKDLVSQGALAPGEACWIGDLTAVLRPAVFVPESMPALRVLEAFRAASSHLALVVDEYGSVQGLVTMNDVMQAIVGEVASEDAIEEPEIIPRPDGSYLLDGMLSVDEFKELFRLHRLPGEERANFHTLGGFIMTQMGRIPHSGETFDWNALHFEIVDMDSHRIDKVLVTPRHPDTAEEP
jgi:putative hemolysin